MVAPHPDDEVLAAGGLIARTIATGGRVHVVVATDGEAGVNRTGAADLADARRDETRRALALAGVAPTDVAFLGYANDGLAAGWSERWRVARRAAGETSADALIEALRTAIRVAQPDAIVLPMTLDEHVDHHALARFALLAVLGEEAGSRAAVLGYLTHGDGRWPACRPGAFGDVPLPPPGCAGLFPWTALRIDAASKRMLVREYRTQLGPTLLRFATSIEPFAEDEVVAADRSAAPWRPGVRRVGDAVAIAVPRTGCLVDPDAGDRLRLRYFRDGALEERIVTFGTVPEVVGGIPGMPLATAHDVRVKERPDEVHLTLDASVKGTVLEVLPGHARRGGPAWLLRWL